MPGTLDWILKQKKDISGKTGEIQTVYSLANGTVPILTSQFLGLNIVLIDVDIKGSWVNGTI